MDVSGLDTLPPADQAAVGETMGRLMTGFATRDVDALAGVYAEDVSWVNAFGTALSGAGTVIDHLRRLFAEDNFRAGEPAGPPEVAVRPVGADAVVVQVHLRIRGQKLVGGGEIALRDNFSLHVLERRDGRWAIVSELYMDARTDATLGSD